MTVPARVKQADIARALREAHKIGAKHVRVEPDGTIDIVLDDGRMIADGQDEAEPKPQALEEGRVLW
jgi:hypothetical protein